VSFRPACPCGNKLWEFDSPTYWWTPRSVDDEWPWPDYEAASDAAKELGMMLACVECGRIIRTELSATYLPEGPDAGEVAGIEACALGAQGPTTPYPGFSGVLVPVGSLFARLDWILGLLTLRADGTNVEDVKLGLSIVEVEFLRESERCRAIAERVSPRGLDVAEMQGLFLAEWRLSRVRDRIARLASSALPALEEDLAAVRTAIEGFERAAAAARSRPAAGASGGGPPNQ